VNAKTYPASLRILTIATHRVLPNYSLVSQLPVHLVMSSSDPGANRGPTTPSPPPEELPDRQLMEHESSNETNLGLSDKPGSLGQVENDINTLSPATPPQPQQPLQLTNDHDSAEEADLKICDTTPTLDQGCINSHVELPSLPTEESADELRADAITNDKAVKPHSQLQNDDKADLTSGDTPGESGDDSPVLLGGRGQENQETEETPSSTGSDRQESSGILPEKSSTAKSSSRELPAPVEESMQEQELSLASVTPSTAASDDDSIPSIFKGDILSIFVEDMAGPKHNDDDEEKENESRDKIADDIDGSDENTNGKDPLSKESKKSCQEPTDQDVTGQEETEQEKTEQEEIEQEEPEHSRRNSSQLDSNDNDSSHNPFDFKASTSEPTMSEISSDSSSVVGAMSANNMWERMKKHGEESDSLDRLMALVGLENVKLQFLKIKATIDAARRRRGWLRRQDLNIAFMGNPGTGKLLMIIPIVSLYCLTEAVALKSYNIDFLIESRVWNDDYKIYKDKMGGFSFQYKSEVEQLYERFDASQPGTLLIDDIDRSNAGIQELLAQVLGGISDKMVIIVTGSVIGVSKVLGNRTQSRWECWRRLQLQDYDDEQLKVMLLRLIDRNHLQAAGGPESPYPLMVARRVGRGRNTEGFGNMHEIALALEQTLERQAHRLKQIQLNAPTANEGNENDDQAKLANDTSESVLTMEDFMGPEPAELWADSPAWTELDKMAGLEDVKKAVRSLMRRSKTNYRRELQGKEPLQMSLNRLFLGPPGTGKTTVAKLYGQILGELGLLSSKEVIFTTPSDFIGPYTGQTETRTSSIIDSAAGKALIIDDAHTFFTRDETSFLGDDLDSFRRACIDTLVSRIHNRPGEDRSVILIGYADKMEDMFQKCNPGLKRRFPLEEAFRFHDYDDKQLNKILQIKMAKEDIKASEEAMDVAAEVLRRARDRPNFGNGGDVDNLLNQAKARCRERQAAEKVENQTAVDRNKVHSADSANGEATHDDDETSSNTLLEEDDQLAISLEPQDLDPEWDRGTNPESGGKASSLFDGLLGFDEIRKQFEGYQLMAANMRQRGKDPRESIPFTYVFKGPPGTGKTHTARIMGKMFYHMGFLSTDDVVECSASHMIGQYTGQTAPKVVSLLDSALGKVLFIDEAYRLTSRVGDRGFESEAIGELVDCMTKPRYLRKMIIILAGYNKDMSQLLKSNAGLRGRFPTEIRFKPMDEELSRAHLMKLLSKQDIEINDEKKPSSDDFETVLRLFYKLGMTEGWSNGRDIQSLANIITAEVYKRPVSIPADSHGNTGGETRAQSTKGKEKETGTSVDAGAANLRISTKELIKYLKDVFRERIKAGASADDSGDRSFGTA
ncbi:hypothetical protein S40288_09971, partial [Stachybotrys chartarum IBT 40288]